MRRRLFTLASLLSLLLCVATSVASVTSAFRAIEFFWEKLWIVDDVGWGDQVRVRLDRGVFELYLGRSRPVDPKVISSVTPRTTWRRSLVQLGSPPERPFEWKWASEDFPGELRRQLLVSFHCICPIVLFAVLPAVWYRTRRRLSRPGHCPTCRYDLTANTSGTCPECGTAVAKGAA